MSAQTIALNFQRLPLKEMHQRARAFHTELARRRTVRDFSAEAVPRALIEQCLATAGTAPSGANQQPWRFVAVADPAVKKAIRDAAESEEQEFTAAAPPKNGARPWHPWAPMRRNRFWKPPPG